MKKINWFVFALLFIFVGIINVIIFTKLDLHSLKVQNEILETKNDFEEALSGAKKNIENAFNKANYEVENKLENKNWPEKIFNTNTVFSDMYLKCNNGTFFTEEIGKNLDTSKWEKVDLENTLDIQIEYEFLLYEKYDLSMNDLSGFEMGKITLYKDSDIVSFDLFENLNKYIPDFINIETKIYYRVPNSDLEYLKSL